MRRYPAMGDPFAFELTAHTRSSFCLAESLVPVHLETRSSPRSTSRSSPNENRPADPPHADDHHQREHSRGPGEVAPSINVPAQAEPGEVVELEPGGEPRPVERDGEERRPG